MFSKRRLLYGLFEAQGAMRQRKRAIVVEGYMDVLAAQRSGMEETVAVMGTSLTAQHAATLKKCAPLAVVVLDADAAGRRAAQVSSAMLLQAGLQVAVGNLPAGEDPDSLLRSGGKARLQEVVDTAPAAMEYFLKEAFAAPPGSAPMSIEARAQAARSLQPLFGALPPGLEKDLYTARLAAQVGVSVEQLQRDLRRHSSVGRKPALPPEQAAPHAEAPRTAAVRPAQQAPKSVTPRPRPEHFELELLRELLLYPELRARFGELADFAISVPMQALLEELAAPAAEVEAVLRAHIDDASWLRSLLAVRPLPDADATYSLHTFEAVLARFKRQHVQAALQDLFAEMRALEARGEATDAHMRRKQELTARKRALYRSRSKRTVVKPSE